MVGQKLVAWFIGASKDANAAADLKDRLHVTAVPVR